MSTVTKLTVSIVVYKPDCEVLERSLISLRNAIFHIAARYPVETQVSIVDNSCIPSWTPKLWDVIDRSMQGVKAELVTSPVNGGYGVGNNLVIAKADSDFHIVANPDIFLDEDAITLSYEYMRDNRDVTLLSPSVFGEDGQRHFLCKRNPTLLVMFLRSFAPRMIKRIFSSALSRFEMRDKDYAKEIDDVEFPTGCFMFFRTAPLKAIQGFDEKFFMYFEDADIGRRIRKLGGVRYVPSVRIVHRWARGSHNNKRLRWITIQSAFIYWRKWGGTL